MDASHVYGSSEDRMKELRSFQDGLLIDISGLLPLEKNKCEANVNQHKNFLAGDIRVNENPGLQSVHTIWLREHNRIAGVIKAKDPGLNDEEIFQEARRYLTAEWQQV